MKVLSFSSNHGQYACFLFTICYSLIKGLDGIPGQKGMQGDVGDPGQGIPGEKVNIVNTNYFEFSSGDQ